MGVTEKMWDALTTVIKMNDRVVSLANAVKDQQSRIEGLTERVIKLETMLELLVHVSKSKQILLTSVLEEDLSS
ncbi:MAG TPA: hypothetical protein VHE99_00460 [Gammaproteobacteria bacterium]|nr:hypothetical protein [Gammaproteobacteria bacterium]